MTVDEINKRRQYGDAVRMARLAGVSYRQYERYLKGTQRMPGRVAEVSAEYLRFMYNRKSKRNGYERQK